MSRRTLVLLASLLTLLAFVPGRAGAQTNPVTPIYRLAGTFDTNTSLVAGTECGVYERSAAPWAKTEGLETKVDDLVRLGDGTLLASSNLRIYRRGPGAAWQQVAEDTNYPKLAVNAAGTRAYALGGLSVAGVTRSDDGGRTWQPATYPIPPTVGTIPWSIAVLAGANGQDTVYAALGMSRGGGTRLFRSTDSGGTWTEVLAAQELPRRIGALYTTEERTTLYLLGATASGASYELYRTTGDGRWETVTLPAQLLTALTPQIVAYGATIVVAGEGGAFRSTDRGATWQPFGQGLESAVVYDLHYTSHAPIGVVMFAATSRGVFGRSDSDAAWMPFSEGLPACYAVTPFTPIPPFTDSPSRVYSSVTGHSLANGFKTYYERNGDLPVFGFPLSEEFDERNADLGRSFTTQYFERQRFEYHPENQEPYRVLLGRMGAELLAAQGRDWQAEAETPNPFPNTACQAFTVGRIVRTACGPFYQYWRTHGLNLDGRSGFTYNESLALFGMPLTAPKVETNPDGKSVLTQWFERARFEYYPNETEPYKVQLGRLGSEIAKSRGVAVP